MECEVVEVRFFLNSCGASSSKERRNTAPKQPLNCVVNTQVSQFREDKVDHLVRLYRVSLPRPAFLAASGVLELRVVGSSRESGLGGNNRFSHTWYVIGKLCSDLGKEMPRN